MLAGPWVRKHTSCFAKGITWEAPSAYGLLVAVTWSVLLKGRHNFGQALESKLRSKHAHREKYYKVPGKTVVSAPQTPTAPSGPGLMVNALPRTSCWMQSNLPWNPRKVIRLFFSVESGSSERLTNLPRVVPLTYGRADLPKWEACSEPPC